jgi:hypothetical protein
MWKGFLGVFEGAMVMVRRVREESEVIVMLNSFRYEVFESDRVMKSLGSTMVARRRGSGVANE